MKKLYYLLLLFPLAAGAQTFIDTSNVIEIAPADIAAAPDFNNASFFVPVDDGIRDKAPAAAPGVTLDDLNYKLDDINAGIDIIIKNMAVAAPVSL